MAAILKLRRGTSIPSLVESELFFDTTNKTVVVGDGSTNHTLVKIGTNTGSVEFSGDITASNITITGNALVQGNITFGGSLITLGDENTDDIVFVGELSSSLIPNNDNAFDIGSSTRRYKSIYGVSASFENVSLPGTGILSSSLQDFDTYSSSIELQLDSVYTFTQSADQRLTSIEGFTQSIDLRVDTLELSQSYFDNTFSGSVDSRLVDAELTGSDHESRIDTIETTFSSSVDLRLDNLELTGSDHETRLDEIETTFSSSVDLRLDDLEATGSDHEARLDEIETTFSSSVDLRLDNAEWTGSDHELRLDEIETTFSSSVDSRLDDAEWTGSNHENRVIDLELTGSDHELRIDEIETTFSSSVDLRLDDLEFFSSSEYQGDSSSFDNRISSLTNKTGSYATTGSNIFIGDQTITGSVLINGDTFTAEGISWPSVGSEKHIIKTEPYTLNLNSGDRSYDYLGISLEHFEGEPNIYHNSLLLYSYNDHTNPLFGSEINVGPLRNHLRVYASGSTSLGNISVEDEENGTTSIKLYSDNLQLGVYTGSYIGIGNDDSINTLRGSMTRVLSPISSSVSIFANEFIGDGSQLTFYGTGILSSSVADFDTYSASVDLRLDTIEGPLSESINQQLNSIHSYTSSLKTAIEVSGQNLTVFGDLVVEGTTTTINTQELLIEDKLLAIASGSTTSTDADGGGFFISGANASILWNHLDQTLDFNTKVSSSVGFKGDGSELINIPYTGIELGGSGIVSGSSQIDLTQTTNYVSGIKTRLNAEGVFSSSIQVNADDITNFDSNVKDKLTNDDVHSGSYLGNATTSNLLEGVNLYWTQDRFLTASYQQGLISESAQLEGVFLEINGDDVVSGSSQIDLTQTTNYVSGIKTRLNSEGVLSGSSQVVPDLDLIYLEINGDDVVSGSSQVDLTQTTNYETGIKTRLNLEGVVSESAQISFPLISGKPALVSGSSQIDLTQTTNYVLGIKERLDAENVFSSSAQVTESLDGRYLEINGDGVVSGSSQISFNGIIDKPSLVSGSSQIDITQTTNYTLFSGSVDGRLVSLEDDQHTHSNKSNLDTINQDLSTTNTPTFINLSLTSLPTLGTGELSAVFSGSAGTLGIRELGTAALYHVSQSIYAEDDNVIGTAGAMKRYIDIKMVEIGAGDITAVTPTPGGGLSGGGLEGHVSFSLDTGSSHFIDGVNDILPIGLISGSSQVQLDFVDGFTPYSNSVDLRLNNLEAFSTSLDDGFVTQNELAIATGALENSIATKLNTGSYNTDSQSFDNRIDNLEGFSSSLDSEYVKHTELAPVTGALENSIATKLDTGSYNIDSESFDLRLDNQESFSSSIDTTIKIKLNADSVISGSSQVNFNDIGNQPFESGSNYVWIKSFSQFPGYFVPQDNDSVFLGFPGIYNWRHLATGELGVIINDNTRITVNTSTNNIKFVDANNPNTQLSAEVDFDTIYNNPLSQGTNSITSSGHFVPSQHETYDLGSPTLRWNKLYLSGSTIDLGGTLITRDNTSGNISFLDGDTLSTLSADVDFTTILNKPTLISESVQVNADTITNFDTNVKDKLNVEGVITGSDQLTGSLVDITSAQSISGTKTFEDIVVNGTGSFAYIQSVTGSAKIIGDAFVVVNNDTPTERYAGLAVYDSGSTNTTASLFFDGQTNDWNYEYFEGGNVDFGVVMFGPEYNTKGSPTYLTNDRIPKGNGGHHLNDSNITDTGTLITLGSNIEVNGNIAVSGTVDGIDLQLLQLDVDVLYGKTLVSGSSQITLNGDITGPANNNQIAAGVIVNNDINANAAISHTKLNLNGSSLVSGSSQITKSLQDVTSVGNTTSNSISITSATASTSKTSGALVVTGGIGLGGSIFAGGDVVAYASSDQRLKDQITPIENSLQKINSIGGYSFVWNEKQDIYKGKDYGVIAQEIENILPELVETREDGYKAVKYDRIVSLLIEGVKELSKEVSELKEKIGK